MLFNLTSFALNNNIEEINSLLNVILQRFVINQDKRLIKKYYKIIIENLKVFSDIFDINLLFYLEDKMNKSIENLINSNKKTLLESLDTFISSVDGMTWFGIHSVNTRKKFYQDNLSKIGCEKYRKIFMSITLDEFKYNIYLLK
jgi:hypothetical protein